MEFRAGDQCGDNSCVDRSPHRIHNPDEGHNSGDRVKSLRPSGMYVHVRPSELDQSGQDKIMNMGRTLHH